MNKARLVTIVSVIVVATIALTTIPFARASSCHSDHEQKPKMDMKKHMEAGPLSLGKIHSQHLPMLSHLIGKAIKAVEAGNKETAVAELHKAQKMLAAINAGIAKHVKPKFANTRCPIMDSPINPDKVAKGLIRDYKGQQIAFCCAGCPSAWDKLSDDEKAVKLTQAVTPNKHAGHMH